MHEVEHLAMDVTIDSRREIHSESVWLVPENLESVLHDSHCLRFGKAAFTAKNLHHNVPVWKTCRCKHYLVRWALHKGWHYILHHSVVTGVTESLRQILFCHCHL